MIQDPTARASAPIAPRYPYTPRPVPDAVAAQRISADECLALLQSHDLIALGRRADAIRQLWHPDNVASYIVDRNINYTNVCNVGCKFCAFQRTVRDDDHYTLNEDQFRQKIDELYAVGGRQILLQGGHHPDYGIAYYETLLRFLRASYPDLWVHGFSPSEVQHICKVSSLSVDEVLDRLIAAGLDSIPGGGAEILTEKNRLAIARNKGGPEKWTDVMRAAHRRGLSTTATMMFGHVESLDERVEHLQRIRDLQDETHGFTAFIPWTFQPGNTILGERNGVIEVGAFEYLKVLAVSRLFLDNIPNLQVSWVTQALGVAQLGLRMGGNDLGSTMLEENVVAAAGAMNRCNEADLQRAAREAGLTPRRRNCHYTLLETPEVSETPARGRKTSTKSTTC
jgi:cyclic dehypoxanthinyl futalosine synthase